MYPSQYRLAEAVLALDQGWVGGWWKKYKNQNVSFQYGGLWKSSGYKNLVKPSPGSAAQIIPGLQSQNSTKKNFLTADAHSFHILI